MRVHLKSYRAVGALVGSPMVARGPALVASPGQPAPVHINLLRPAGISTRDQRPGRAIASGGGSPRNSISTSAIWNESGGLPFKRSKIVQTLIDVFCVIIGLSLIIATAGSIVVSGFLLFFASF